MVPARKRSRMKPKVSPSGSGGRFTRGEHVRVVPLYQPKPKVPIEGAREIREVEETRLASLTYRGGPLLTRVEVYTIFWGVTWKEPAGQELMKRINDFYHAILPSPLLTQMEEYNVAGQQIGHGVWVGSKAISTGAPKVSVTDTTVRTWLKKWTNGGTVRRWTKNALYFIYLDPGIVSVMGGARSCQSFCGYHNNAGKLYYAVMPYPSCTGCLGGMDPFDALTGTSSHELCEAITDPVPGTGWYDDNFGEIGDICAWRFKQVVGYTVQLEWSNKHQGCI